MSDSLLEFLEEPSRAFAPTTLGTPVAVDLHRPDGVKRIHIETFFPFMTFTDLKLAIYEALGKRDSAIPECIFLTKGDETVDFIWIGQAELPLSNPLEAAVNPVDTRFVDSAGNKRILKFVSRDRMMLEDMYDEIPVFSAYLYEDVLAQIPGAKPPSERDWNGLIAPYFPYLTVEGPTDGQVTRAQRMYTIFKRRLQFSAKIEDLLTDSLEPLRLTGLRALRLLWHKPESIPGIEAIFYDTNVNAKRPYMRFMPTEGSPISKVFLVDGAPDLADPKLLLQWSQERSPIPNHDFVMAKVLVKPGYVNVAPIYGTIRALDDGTADYTLLPPKGARKLDPGDLRRTWSFLQEVQFSFLKEPVLDNGIFVFGLKLAGSPVTAKVIREKIPMFAAFFQETLPLEGDNPLISIRYKAVSNFATEDRVATFITQVLNRKMLREEGVSNLVEIVAEEFQLDMEEAQKRVATRLQQQGDIAIVKPDTGEFMGQYNPGIDIYIFGQHPFYTFHIHRANSFKTLRRITMLLSLLMGGAIEDFHVSKKVSKELAKAEADAAGLPFEEVDVASEADAEAPPAAAAPSAVADEFDEGYDAFLDDFAAEYGDEEVVAAAATAEMPAAPKTDVNAGPEPPLPNAVVKAPPPRPPPEEVNAEVSTTKDTSIANFFINKLKEADRRLFDYTKSHPSLKKYVQQCQPTDGRQPAVLTQDKYDEMLAEYKKDNVMFVLYPLEADAEPPAAGQEYYTVLRYGTAKEKQHYYLCSQFFCTRDEILVREADLQSTKMRRPLRLPNGQLKTTKKGGPDGQCPFCAGDVIKNKKSAGPNDVVIERGVKKQSDNRRHLYIRFLKKTPHPEGFYLPCCFIEPETIKETDAPFDKYRELGIATHEVEAEAEAEAPPPPRQGPVLESGIPLVDYYSVLQTLGKRGKYILGSEKFPLELGLVTAAGRGEPQVGLLLPELDEYFNQTNDFVTRTLTQQTLKEGGTGFLRVGVENRVRYKGDSFLAAVAPFFKMNSAAEVKARIKSVLTARSFLGLNYGNMVLEFYNPRLPRPTDRVLEAWAEEELETSPSVQTRESLHRLYNSWASFQLWLQDTKTQKEYRHFALFFSQPGLFEGRAKRGTTFIVLDILPSGKVDVKCPPYGYNDDIMGRNNIGFLLHKEGVWEPIFYMDNRDPASRQTDAATLSFDGTYKGFTGIWPKTVKERVSEFTAKCNFSGRSVYTSQSRVNPAAMIPLSLIYRALRKPTDKNKALVFEGVVRDSYNHVGAVLYRKKTSSGFVAVPVIDDGDLAPTVMGNVILDWDDHEYKKATIIESLDFYKEYIDTDFSLYPGYVMQSLVRKGSNPEPRPLKDEDIPHLVAIKLRNGLYIPISKPTDDLDHLRAAASSGGATVVEIEEEEWAINNDIMHDKAIKNPIDAARIEYEELQELFEHLRLTMSNFLATKGSALRETLQTIVMDRTIALPEKRKQLEILLGPIVMNQMMTEEPADGEPSILRTDCTLRGEGECKGRCAWVKAAPTEVGKCLLHVGKEVDLGKKRISVRLLLLRRLNEELIRFSERRRQIFDQKVSQMATLEGPITVDSQLIIPERSVAWFELLRLEWGSKRDEPRYLEEMARPPVPRAVPTMAGEPVPQSLIEALGADPKWDNLRVAKTTWPAIFTSLGLSPAKYDLSGGKIRRDQMKNVVLETGKHMIYVGEETLFFKPVHASLSGVAFILEDGPGLIVTNPGEITSLQLSDLPDSFAERFKRGIRITPVKPGE